MELIDYLTQALSLPMVDLTDRSSFVRNMQFSYSLMLASEDLLQEAIDKLNLSVTKTDFECDLLTYYNSHIEEERGHDKWLADDILELGEVPKRLSMEAALAAGSQYYLIRHIHPAALLGYMAVLEGFPMDLSVVKQLEVIYGEKALRTLRYHAENDKHHRVDLFNFIRTVPVEFQQLIADNALCTVSMIHLALQS